MEYLGQLFFGATLDYMRLRNVSTITKMVNLPAVEPNLAVPLFYPFALSKKGFLGIISKTVRDNTFKP